MYMVYLMRSLQKDFSRNPATFEGFSQITTQNLLQNHITILSTIISFYIWWYYHPSIVLNIPKYTKLT